MKREVQSDEFAPTGECLCQSESSFDGLRAAVAKEGLLQLPRRNLGQLGGEMANGRDLIEVGAAVNELLHLLTSGGQNAGITVTRVDDGDARKTVEIALPVGAVDVSPFRALHDQRLDACEET